MNASRFLSVFLLLAALLLSGCIVSEKIGSGSGQDFSEVQKTGADAPRTQPSPTSASPEQSKEVGEEGGLSFSCGENYSVFSESPVDLSKVSGIAPLGNLNPPGHVFPTLHTYFYLKLAGKGDTSPAKASLTSPGEIVVTELRSSSRLSESPPASDYSIYFRPCAEVTAYFGHVTSLSDALLQEFSSAKTDGCNRYLAGGKEYESCVKPVSLKVSPGELLGSVGGQEGQYAFDFGMWDARESQIKYARPERWHEQAKTAVCPLNYFSENVRAPLMALLGKDRTSSANLDCGRVGQDLPGTLAGVWFSVGTKNTYPEDPHVALVRDNYYQEEEAFSIGTSVEGIPSGSYRFSPKAEGKINKKFSAAVPGEGVFCYETSESSGGRPAGFVILAELVSDNYLKLGKGAFPSCGSGPWNFSGFSAFER